MSRVGKDCWDDEFSGDKEDLGFIDFEDDQSICCYDPNAEGPVTISTPFPLIRGKPQSVVVGETSVYSITLQNTSSEQIELWRVKIFCSNPADSFTLSVDKPPSMYSDIEHIESFLEGFSLEDRTLQPHRTLTIWLSCKPKDIGMHTSIVHFDVGDDRIERVVFLLAEDKISLSLAASKPKSSFPQRKQLNFDQCTKYATKRTFKIKVLPFEIPVEIRELLENDQLPRVFADGLMRENYCTYFNMLLIMEELHLEKEMKRHDMESVTMGRKGALLMSLEVPGLAERRPSLVHGDFVFVKLACLGADYSDCEYKGYIYRVEADEVLLKFPSEFYMHHLSGNLYNIRFTYNRANMKRLYQAVLAAEILETDTLFPSQSTERLISKRPIKPFKYLNEEQRYSVEMILGCQSAPPYVIYGPPGTGKTMTLVEAILQLYTTRNDASILICAASNSAADHILEKLLDNLVAEVKENEIFRLNASSRSYQDVKANHIHFCYFEGQVFRCPPLEALLRYRVIVSTYMSSSLLYKEGITRGHFSHIFLDEAGQATEPETMIPMSNFCKRETVVVLAGDPKQLGPVVYSRDAISYGLGKSYLERLCESGIYQNGDGNFITKLVRNYRCHPAILDLPSNLFYTGQLIACKANTSSPKSWLSILPHNEFPILFIGIQGCDEREGNNPSWFNRVEASKVIDLIKRLTTTSPLREADIGVITPYRQQVIKITKALESLEIPDVKVGSVEQFQGQEREIIIVSTVRSTVKHNDYDRTYCLGFLSNPKRFNVAITRAKSLLIIVGNPHIVSKDPYWHKLLWYCCDNNSYHGCPVPTRMHNADADKTATT